MQINASVFLSVRPISVWLYVGNAHAYDFVFCFVFRFLETVQSLPMYGVHYFNVKVCYSSH